MPGCCRLATRVTRINFMRDKVCPARARRGAWFRLSAWWACLCVGALFSCAAAAQTPQGAIGQARPAATQNPAGTIDLVEGDARLIPAGAQPRAAKVGDVVSEGDSLVTGKDGEVHLTMQDTGFIALRPNTQFRVESFKADGGSDDKAIFRLLAGGFRAVTGWIGKYNPGACQIRTTIATIGIRGTDHEPHYIPEGSTEGEPGIYDKVYVGSTYIENPDGRTAVAPNQAGFVPFRGRRRPQLLARVPGFFRPSRYEPMIERKHAEIQRMIAQRREERRKVVAEKRAALEASQQQAKALREKNKAAAGERRKAAQERRQGVQGKRQTLEQESKAAQEMHKDVQEKRNALQEQNKSGQPSDRELQEQRKALGEENKAALEKRRQVQEQRKALREENQAAKDERIRAAQEARKAMKDQRKDVQEKRKALQAERKDAREEIETLREQERERYRKELKAARQKQKGAGTSGPDSDEKAP